MYLSDNERVCERTPLGLFSVTKKDAHGPLQNKSVKGGVLLNESDKWMNRSVYYTVFDEWIARK